MFSSAKAQSLLFVNGPTSSKLPTTHGSVQNTRRSTLMPRLTCGDFTNCLCALLATTGIALLACNVETTIGRSLAVIGACGFGAGILNSIFIYMLFHRVCGLQWLGAGVFLREADAYTIQWQRLIVQTFFTPSELTTYAGKVSSPSLLLSQHVQSYLSQDHAHHEIVEALTHIASTTNGTILNSFAGMFGGIEPMVPKVKPLLIAIASEWDLKNQETLQRLNLVFGPSTNDVIAQRLAQELGNYLHTRAMRLEPKEVAFGLESLIKPHLTWIVVWGNLCGLIVGCLVALYVHLVLAQNESGHHP